MAEVAFFAKNWLTFFGFAGLEIYIVWSRQTTHFNQNGRLSTQNSHILHFESQELAKSAIFAKKVADFFGFASLDRFIVWNRQTTHSNQNGRPSIQNFNILHFGSQELAKSAIFAKKKWLIFWFCKSRQIYRMKSLNHSF